MALAKSFGYSFSTSSIASNARYYTAEVDVSNVEFATIYAYMTHAGAAGGVSVIPIGKMAGSWFPFPSPVVNSAASGGITTPVSNNPPYSTNFTPQAAFGYQRPYSYFIAAPPAGTRIGAAILVNCQAYTKIVVCIENYASQQDNVTIFIGGGSKY